MEWSFDCGGGAVTVRQEGEQAVCQALCRQRNGGLYKAWLEGPGGRALLGTLLPEGGALRLRRTIPVVQLKRQGVWPPTGAAIEQYDTPRQQSAPAGWQWTGHPGRLLADKALAAAIQRAGCALLRREESCFYLAFPCKSDAPFPIPPLFCLSAAEVLAGESYYLFRFSPRGRPELIHNEETG